MRVERISSQNLKEWQYFVDGNSKAGPYHHAGWFHVLQECFAVEPYYLWVVNDNAETQGILPMYFSRSIFTGKHLSTLEGGVASNNSAAKQLLCSWARELINILGVRYILIRGDSPHNSLVCHEMPTVRNLIRLDGSPDELWSSLNSNTRRKVRKARKNGFMVEERLDLLYEFYQIYAMRVRDLGTPTMGPDMFLAMKKYLKKYVRLQAVLLHGQIVGGMFLVASKDLITSLYVAVMSDLLPLYPTYLLYWTAIEKAFRSTAATWLDFGRSIPGSGNHRFKQQWSKEEHQVSYFYCFNKNGNWPKKVKKTHTETSFKQLLWKRLPLSFSNFLGPILRRQLPFG